MKSDIEFSKIKNEFIYSDLDKKIEMYTTSDGLSTEQFKELLKNFPLEHLDKLERAMA